MKDRKKFWRIVINIVFAVLVIALVVPASRSWIQQGLMKIGFFKPSLEAPQDTVAQKKETPASAASSANVSFSNEKGEVVHIKDLAGKVVFVNFWATWCPPCKAEMPSIQQLKDKFGDNNDDVVFMLVEIDGEAEKAREFMKQGKMDLPIYFPESEIPSNWLGQSIPTTVILDKDGNVAAHHEGMADYSRKEVFEFITNLIKK